MGCLTGTWRSNSLTDARLSLKGGSGAVLTISGNGTFVMNADSMHSMSFSQSGLHGSISFSGQETGTFRVSGTKLTGVYHLGTFAASSDVNGIKFKLPLSKFGEGNKALGWQSFNCSGNTLTMINPPPASTWTFTRTS
jgi:Lipocalin-like domain